jgi:hypothetical protein
MAVAYFKVGLLFRYLPGETKDNLKNARWDKPSQSRDLKAVLPECEGVLTTRQ